MRNIKYPIMRSERSSLFLENIQPAHTRSHDIRAIKLLIFGLLTFSCLGLETASAKGVIMLVSQGWHKADKAKVLEYSSVNQFNAVWNVVDAGGRSHRIPAGLIIADIALPTDADFQNIESSSDVYSIQNKLDKIKAFGVKYPQSSGKLAPTINLLDGLLAKTSNQVRVNGVWMSKQAHAVQFEEQKKKEEQEEKARKEREKEIDQKKISPASEGIDVPSKLKELNILLERKKWQDLSEACKDPTNSTEEILKPFVFLGEDLASALKDADIARQNKPQVSKEVARIRRNADVVGRPNSLYPEDRPRMERANRMREEATMLESKADEAIKEAKDRIDQVASVIERQIVKSTNVDTKQSKITSQYGFMSSYLADTIYGSALDFEQLRKGALMEISEAQYVLGLCYNKGVGIPKDDVEAAKWFRKVAEQDGELFSSLAQFGLGDMYLNGRGVPQDYTEAAKWFRKAAIQGHIEAKAVLGQLYGLGNGVPQDYTEAAKWFREAADAENTDAQCTLGLMYRAGKGVPQDDAEAVKWLHKAVKKDHEYAKVALGYMYLEGRGVPQDDDAAEKLCRQAAEGGNSDAQSILEQINSKRKN